MNFLKYFRKNAPDLTFIDDLNVGAWKTNPPVLAKNIKALKDHQTKKYNDYKFVGCPGMHDYSRLGYIIPAWTPLRFKANRAGVAVYAGSKNARGSQYPQPKPMQIDIADGIFTYEDGINQNVFNIPSPWRIIGSPNLSALIFPAYYHNKELNDNLYVYPGIVDYNNTFTAINLICSIKNRCEFTIKEGEPLLHVIPFKVQEINAQYDIATEKEKSYLTNNKFLHVENFYRKYYLVKKKFKLTLRNNE
jgi:hypothetical protein